MQMPERWDKVGLHVLRADPEGAAGPEAPRPPVIVNNGGQVNVAGQQVNQQQVDVGRSGAGE